MAKGIYVGVDNIVKKDIIPKTWTEVTEGTQYKTADGTILNAKNWGNYPAYMACDGNESTLWQAATGTAGKTGYLELNLSEPQRATKMLMKLGCTSTATSVDFTVTIWGRLSEETEWIELHTFNTTILKNDRPSFTVELSNLDYYKYYRLNLSASDDSIQVYEWQAYKDVIEPNIAHKVKKAYVGVDNIARKVKKAYVGVAGVARLFFSSERKLEYYGNAPALGTGRKELAGASSPNHAIFAGGENSSSTKFDATDAYDKNLVKATIDVLAKARSFLGGASNPNYAVFAGGRATSYTGNVDGYDVNLVRTTATSLSKSRHRMGATSVGNYACFGGGFNSDAVTNVDFYDTSLTRTYLADGLTTAVQFLSGSNTPNYALFAGGYTSGTDDCQSQVIAFSSNLTKSTPTGLTTARYKAFGVGVGNYALFAGGGYYQKGNYSCNDVDAYNDNLVKVTVNSLSFNTTDLKGVGINREFAIIVKNSGQVDMYNADLVKTSINNSLKGTGNPTAGASIGDYGLICGYGSSNIVDVYQAV